MGGNFKHFNLSGILKVFDGIEDYAIFLLDNKGLIKGLNTGAEKITGFSEIDGYFSIFYPKDARRELERDLEIARRSGYRGEKKLLVKGGSEFEAEIFISPFDDFYLVVIKDLGMKKAVEERRKRTERALKVLGRTNRAIIQSMDEKELLEEICKIVVDEGYLYTWVGYAGEDKSVKAVARAGKNGYADAIKVTWDETETGMGPTGTAIRERRVVMARDITKDLGAPWREEAEKRGFASSVTLPLMYGNNVFGALNVYASEKDAFDEEEVKLLQEVANNLAYAIAMLRSRRKEEKMNEIVDVLWKLATKDLEYKTLLKEILKEIIKITSSEYGFFGILSEDGKELVVLAWSEEVMDECKLSDFKFPLEKGGLWAEAIRQGRRIISNDYESYPEKRLPKEHVRLRKFLLVPVIKNRIVSLVGVANKDKDYTEEDAEMLEFFMKNAQELLEKKRIEEIYKTLIENTGTAMLIADSETRIKFTNQEAESMLGVPREKILGRSWTEFASEDELEKLLEYTRLRDIDPSLAPKTFETKLERNGDILHILLNIAQIPGTKDRIASFIDITELKKAQEMLRESEERYRTLFEKSRDGIILTGIDMKIIDCNDAALELSGLSKEEVIEKSFLELGVIEKSELPFVMEMFYKGLRGAEVGTIEMKAKLKGETKWVEVSPTTLKKNGKPFTILNLIRDITERKRLEEDLKLSLERLRILHELDLGIIEGKSFEEISKLALHRLRELLGFEAAGLFKYDEEKNEIFLECSDTNLKIFKKGFRLPFKPRLPMEKIKKGEFSYVNNLLEVGQLTSLEKELLRAGIRSYLHVPLIVRRELMGILCLATKKLKAFDEKLKFIKEISDQLAIALHEAELFEMKMRSIERLEKNVEEFAILIDHIRNPLAIITGTTELEIKDEKVKRVIEGAVAKIEDVVGRLDKGWLESEQIRNFLKRWRG